MRIPVRHQIRKDETVLSWVARLHRTGTLFNERQARELLLGCRKVRIHSYLPSHIGHLAKSTGQSVDALLNQHTLYPLFWWFGLETDGRLREAMIGNKGDRAIILAGIPHAKLNFFEGVKYCPVCVSQNHSSLGFSYFKIHHQIPGIEACSEHGCELVGLESGDYGYDRHLPLPSRDSDVVAASSIQVRFAGFAQKVLQLSELAEHPLDYQSVYTHALSERELVTPYHHIRLRCVLEDMDKYFNPFIFGSLLGIPSALQRFAFVGPLLRNKTHFPCHPIKHLLFSYWLFDGDASFLLTSHPDIPQCSELSIYAGIGLANSHTQREIGEHRKDNTTGLQKQKIIKAAATLKQARKEHPQWRRKELKAAYAVEFFLLYHQHRTLLERILPPKVFPIHPEKDWAQEDTRLLMAIKFLSSINQLSLSEIEYRINGRGFLRKNLAKLPKTRALLKQLGKLPNK